MRRPRLLALGTLTLALALGTSCKDDVDYVRVVLQSSDPQLGPSLDVKVLLTGGTKASDFSYTAQLTKTPPDLSDFTVTFDSNSPHELDIRAVTRPSGKSVDWGGNIHVTLPGSGRTLPLEIFAGEQQIVADVHAPDGDTDSIAPYGPQVAIAWPTSDKRVSAVRGNIQDDRVTGSTDRAPELGTDVKKVRVTSRPSQSFTSELFVTSWIESDLTPVLRTELRNVEATDPLPIEDLPGITDLHVAVDPSKSARLTIVSAALANNRVVVWGHDENGKRITDRIESPALTGTASLVGVVVTPNETLSLAVTGNGSRLIQISLKNDATLGTRVAEQALSGLPVAMSLTADGSRILVATVSDPSDLDKSKLQLEVFSAANPAPTSPAPIKIAPFPFVAGAPGSRVALSSCAIAWPQLRADDSQLVDVWFSQLDFDQKPTDVPHVAHVSQDGNHWSPSLACFSSSSIFATMLTGVSVQGDSAHMMLRRLPTQ